MTGRPRPRSAYPQHAIRPAPARAVTPAERRADEILEEIPDADWDVLTRALAGLVISAARSGRRWRSISGPLPADVQDPAAKKSAARG